MDWQIVYRNASYDRIFSNQPYGRLPNDLIRILRLDMDRYAFEKFAAAPIEIPFFRLERRTFWIKLAKIEVKSNDEALWLLRIERIVDVNCKMIRRLQEKGLTSREIEICLLLKEGMETRLIATRLCVSYNTTRNHLQSIFKKTSVTTQVQLSAYLNQYQE
jgi:DNA-binding CsgD family transcriptional regulator